KKKSDLDSSKLFNLTSYYTDITWQLDESNKISTDQLLNNTIILKNIDISVLKTSSLKVEFNSSDLANQFKGKNIDIYGLYFGNKCVGLTEEKTSCLYGGVTIHDGNQLDEEKVIGVNVFKDGVQQEGFVIKTKKAKVTVQELDTKVRFKLENLYKIYNKDTGNIQKGCIFFHSHNHQDQSFYYDLYNVKGSVGAEFFQFYSDNRTVSSSNY
ncbi:TPA: staphylococcal enterotoxin type N, partial [Staphylococcus aureus]|nr:staphylococcal enterotoxin type N [Staphylococcus aureus]